jgi:hypothetical protein
MKVLFVYDSSKVETIVALAIANLKYGRANVTAYDAKGLTAAAIATALATYPAEYSRAIVSIKSYSEVGDGIGEYNADAATALAANLTATNEGVDQFTTRAVDATWGIKTCAVTVWEDLFPNIGCPRLVYLLGRKQYINTLENDVAVVSFDGLGVETGLEMVEDTYAGKYLTVVSGLGAGITSKIMSNTGTTLLLEDAFDGSAIDNTSVIDVIDYVGGTPLHDQYLASIIQMYHKDFTDAYVMDRYKTIMNKTSRIENSGTDTLIAPEQDLELLNTLIEQGKIAFDAVRKGMLV